MRTGDEPNQEPLVLRLPGIDYRDGRSEVVLSELEMRIVAILMDKCSQFEMVFRISELVATECKRVAQLVSNERNSIP
jgi:hypothetical protein